MQGTFKAVDSIPFGSDFAKVIAERLSDCTVVIVLVGRFWLTARGQDGTPRLLNPADYVRIEIEQALKSRAVVVPALLRTSRFIRLATRLSSVRVLAPRPPEPGSERDVGSRFSL